MATAENPESSPAPHEGLVPVRELMSPGLITMAGDIAASEAIAFMAARRIRHLPVVGEGGRLLGLTSEQHLLRLARERDLSEVAVREVMHLEVHTVTADSCALGAARHIVQTREGCLPVVDDDGRLVGIVTEADFVRFFVSGAPACDCEPTTFLA